MSAKLVLELCYRSTLLAAAEQPSQLSGHMWATTSSGATSEGKDCHMSENLALHKAFAARKGQLSSRAGQPLSTHANGGWSEQVVIV